MATELCMTFLVSVQVLRTLYRHLTDSGTFIVVVCGARYQVRFIGFLG